VGREPYALPIVPFNLETCTLADRPTPEEQAAYDAHASACPTREMFWDRATQADWMLDLVRANYQGIPLVPEAQLRRFALRCVERLHGVDAPPLVELLQAVERRITSTVTLDELQSLQRKARPTVTPRGVQGLPRFSTYAAGALAAWHSATPDPYKAAYWTAEFAARHDAFAAVCERAGKWKCPDGRGETRSQSWHAALFAHHHPHVYRGALIASRTRQAGLLRSILPAPFTRLGPPLRREVYGREYENEPGHVSFYCETCGEALKGDRFVLFDVCGTSCSGCGLPLDSRLH
jgi:hypothetical protein